MNRFRIVLLLAVATLATVGCQKKEDAPPPYYPHVSGTWSGNGTDDAIGFFNFGVDMTQSGDSAAGTFTMTGGVADVKGDFAVRFGPQGGNNVQSLTLTRSTWTVTDPANANRLCAATLTVKSGSTFITGSNVSFHYSMTDCQGGTWFGGANLHKVAGTN